MLLCSSVQQPALESFLGSVPLALAKVERGCWGGWEPPHLEITEIFPENVLWPNSGIIRKSESCILALENPHIYLKPHGISFLMKIDRLPLSLVLIWTSENGSLIFTPWVNHMRGLWLLWGLLSWIKFKSLLFQQDVEIWAAFTPGAIVSFTVSAEGKQGVSEGLKDPYILRGKR